MKIEEMIRYDEGSKLSLYKDTEGYWTIGIGHLIKRDATLSRGDAVILLNRKLNRTTAGTITHQEQTRLLANDLASILLTIADSSFYAVYKHLDTPRQMAIMNMCFQLGVRGVAGFKNMWRYLSQENYQNAYYHGLDSKWFKQTPNRSRRVMSVLRDGNFNSYK